MVLMDGEPVVFKRNRLSTAEAEYKALALATQELEWLRQLLDEIGAHVVGPTHVKVDNMAAISIASTHGYRARAKSIDLRLHFIRDHIDAGHIDIEHVVSTMQLADYLTKPLPTPQFVEACRCKRHDALFKLRWSVGWW
ncbi:hypothetical protein ON010_g7341 [Phytophthora cinnamomi]|nr:hypothetical protein ON010_g7341 [Phytophthora cinnamomi]